MNPELPKSQLLISATTSHRRNEALKQLPDVDLRVHPGPKNELESDDTALIAADKAIYLTKLIETAIKDPDYYPIINAILHEIIETIDRFHGHFKVIAADIRTATNEKLGELEKEKFISHAKPKNIEEFQQTIFNMNKAQKTIYEVFAGSQILTYDPKNELPVETKHAQRIEIKLKPDRFRQLNTDKELEEYITRFREFYSSSAYSKNGLPSIDFTDISAGLSLPQF